VLRHYCARYAITARAMPLLRALRHYCARCAIAARAMPLLRALRHYCARYAITARAAPLLRALEVTLTAMSRRGPVVLVLSVADAIFLVSAR
jgi:hypothetical protein